MMGNKNTTLDDIKRAVKELDPVLKQNHRTFKIAVIMLSALEVGADEKKVANFTGYPTRLIDTVSKNLRANKVWVGKKTHCNWFDEEAGGVEFWLDVCVAEGTIVRSSATAS